MTDVEATAREAFGGGWLVEVRLVDDGDVSRHQVAVKEDELPQAAKGRPVEDVVVASFRFLLDREPKEAIMTRFDLSVIERYFPEYPEKVASYF